MQQLYVLAARTGFPRGGWLGTFFSLLALLLALPGLVLAQGPTITGVSPISNTRSAPRTSPVQITFNQALTAGSSAALKVHSLQRRGLRTAATLAVVSGSTITFTPPTPLPFMPGETVYSTTTTTAASSTGALAKANVSQFTAGVGGTGTGAFRGGSDVGAGRTLMGMAMGDVDGDGDLDMLLIDNYTEAVMVRLNDGAGNFTTTQTITNGQVQLNNVIMGDVDGDGDLDMLLMEAYYGTAGSIFLNNGTGTFTDNGYVGGGLTATNVVFGDVNGDGYLDVLVTDSYDQRVYIRLNNGSGTFRGTPTSSFPDDYRGGVFVGVGRTPTSVAVGDFDGDGDLDLVTANSYDNTVSVRFNNGSGTFSGGTDVALANGGAISRGVVHVAVGDVDGDSDLDVLAASGTGSGNNVSVLTNNGSGTFSPSQYVTVGNGPMAVTLGDIDADGDLDLTTANINGSSASVRLNNGTGTFGGGSDVGTGYGASHLAMVDLDGDGDLDLATSNTANPSTVSVRLNQPQAPAITSFTPTSGPVSTTLSLTGTNLTGATAITFTGTSGNVVTTGYTVASATSITGIVVPSGAQTGTLTVTASGGTSAASSQTFTVVPAPVITSFTPTSGPVGTSVAITGTNLLGTTAVRVNGTTATITGTTTATNLSFTVAAGSTSGALTLASPAGTAASAPTPVLRLQATGGSGGDKTIYLDQVEILHNGAVVTGAVSNPSFETGAPAGNLNYSPTTVTSWTFLGNGGNAALSTTASAFAPPAPPDGSAHLVVLQGGTPYLEQPLSLAAGTYQVRMQLAQRQCCTAPSDQGVNVLINDVAVGATLSTSSAGFVSMVSAPFSVSNAGVFTLILPPTITSFSTTSGVAGTSLTLTGTNLTGATSVSVNGVAVTPTGVGSTSLTFVVPAGAGATQSITVTTPGGTSAASTAFTVLLKMAGTNPAANARTAPTANSATAVTFTEPVTAASATNLKIFSAQLGGLKVGTVTVTGSTARFAATAGTARTSFKPGEVVNVSVPATVANAGGLTSARRVYQFTAAAGGTGRGNFLPGSNVALGGSYSVAVGDVNGDGSLDVLTAGFSTVNVQLNNGSGTMSNGGSYAIGNANHTQELALGDLDGDGDLDFVVASESGGVAIVRFNDGLGTFSGGGNVTVGANPYCLALGDVDGDGDLDLLTGNAGGLSISTRFNDGTGTFSGSTDLSVSPQRLSGLALGDLDGDGDLDVAGGSYAGAIVIRLNDGAGTFSGSTNLAVASAYGVALGDLDADGDLDVLAVNGQVSGLVYVRLNDGNATFTSGPDLTVGEQPQGVTLGDVDADGDLDVVAANRSSATLNLFLNDGTGSYSSGISPTAGYAAYSAALADLDGDGDLDMITGGFGMSVRFNQAPVPALTAVAPNPGGLGQSITLTGTSLDSPTALTINGANALAGIISNTGTSLVVRVPAAAAASGNVSLTTASGTAGFAFAVMAPPGNALAFDGTNDYLSLPSGLNTANFTFEAWVNYQDNGFFTRIFDFGSNGNTWMMLTPKTSYAGNVGYLGFGIVVDRSTAAETTILSTTPLAVGRWQHVAVTLAATTGGGASGTLYLNGQIIGTNANLALSPAQLGTLTNNWLGRSQYSLDPYLKALLDEVRVWSTARTQAEVQADMLAPATTPFPAGLQFYLNTDQGVPATASTGANTDLTTLYDLASAQPAGLNNFALTSGNTASNYVESYAMVVPTATAATSQSTSGFTANWTAPALGTVDNGYRLDVSTSSTFASAISGSPFTVASGTSLAITGLLAGTTYYYRVRADKTSVTGQGTYSDVISATTTTLTPPGNALALDGANDYVRIPDSNALDFGTGDFTVEAWVLKQANSSSYSNAVGPGGKWNTGASPGTNEWLLQTTAGGSDNLPSFLLESGTIIYAANGTVPVPLNRWTHLAGVRQGGSLLLYVNGVLQATTTIPAGAAVNNITGLDLLLGAIANNTTAAYFANERLDELRIWNVARTAAQLLAGMLNVATVPQTGLVAYYNFDQGIAGGTNTNQTVLPDLTSNGNNGTLNNFALTGSTSNWVESYALVVPTATAATAVGNNTFTANWTAPTVGTVTNYLVDVSTSSTFASAISGSPFTVATGTTSLVVSGQPGGTHYYRVRADKTSVTGQGATSNFITVVVPSATLSCSAGANNAFNFDGGSDYVHSASTLPATGEFTLETWVNPTSLPGGFSGLLLSDNSPAGAMHWQFNGTALEFSVAGSNPTDQFASFTVPTGSWSHVAVVYSASAKTAKFYLNGVLQNTVSYTTAAPMAALSYSVGGWLSGGSQRFLNGSLNELRVWSVARTDAQVLASYNQALPAQTGLVILYSFDQGTAGGTNTGVTTLNDDSGNGHSGTLNTFALTGATSNWVAGNTLAYTLGLSSFSPGSGAPSVLVTLTGSGFTGATAVRFNGTAATFTVVNGSTITAVVPAGATSGTLTVTGPCGTITSSSSFTVCALPVAIAQNIGVTLDVNGNATTTATAVNNGSTANCGPATAGTLSVSPSSFSCTDAVPATVAGVLGFNGTTQYVEGTNANLPQGNAARTIEAWVYPTVAGQNGALFNYGTPTSNLRAGILLIGGKLYYVGENNDLSGNTALPVNAWSHVAATYDGSTLRLYVNGVLDASGNPGAFNTTGTVWRIAQRSYPQTGEFLTGNVDEVRVWNVARTAAQISANRNVGLPGVGAGLVAYYRLNEGSGSTTADATASASIGTLYNTPTWTTNAPAVVNGSPVTLTVTDAGGNTATASAVVTVSVPATPTTAWNGSTSTAWTACQNWSYGQVPDAVTNAVIPVSKPFYPTVGTGLIATKDLTIDAGGSLTVAGAAMLQVDGNLTNNGTTTFSGPVQFVGSAATQTLTNSSGFNTMVVNKPTGTVQLGQNLTINSDLALTSGTLTTTGSYQVNLGGSAALSESDASYVLGKVVVSRALAPGSAEPFAGLGLTLTPATGSTAPGATQVTRTTGTAISGAGTSQSILRNFDIRPATNTGLNVVMDFAYFTHELNGIPVGNLALFKSVSGGTPWIPQRGTTAAGNVVTKTGITDFSVWTLGNAANPLPVELTAFTATAQNHAVLLNWRTASEQNTARFDVERSADGTSFGRTDTVAAAGTSTAPREYAFTDAQLPAGIATLHYRLKQVDQNGTFSYSPVRSVRLSEAAAGLALYPNPTTARTTLAGTQPGALVQVLDALGRVVVSATADVTGMATLVLPTGLATGVYVVRTANKALRLTVE